jgi:AcrR family transcriptional regulator
MTEAQLRQRILVAMLEVSGRCGYRKATVKDVYERCGGYRMQFYRHFANKADCFRTAYEAEIEQLCRRLLRVCEGGDGWADGLRAALEELAAFVCESPDLAAGLLAEAHVAGPLVGAKRAEVVERLTRAVDGARRETSASRHSPPPITASFMISAIEESVMSALARGAPEEFAAAVPSLSWLGTYLYFGEGA